MKIKVNKDLIQEEVDSAIGKGAITVYNTLDSSLISKGLPREWFKPLQSNPIDKKSHFVGRWKKSEKFPKLSSVLEEKLNNVFLGYSNIDKSFIFLYIFTSKNDIIIFKAGLPYLEKKTDNEVIKKIHSIYSIHDGYSLLNGGIIHICDQKELIEQIEQSGADDFIKVLQVNTDWAGYGMDGNFLTPYIIWSSDEEVETIDDIYEEIDDWLAMKLLEYDDYES